MEETAAKCPCYGLKSMGFMFQNCNDGRVLASARVMFRKALDDIKKTGATDIYIYMTLVDNQNHTCRVCWKI
jgi:hypothetical protein